MKYGAFYLKYTHKKSRTIRSGLNFMEVQFKTAITNF